jgi:hypothetical protein
MDPAIKEESTLSVNIDNTPRPRNVEEVALDSSRGGAAAAAELFTLCPLSPHLTLNSEVSPRGK